MSSAQWKVAYQNLADDGLGFLYLASADLADVRKAKQRALSTAKERLTKKGLKVRMLSCQCVG